MKTSLRLLSFVLLIVALSSCRTKSPISNAHMVEPEILYRQALKALDEQKFIIKANEFYFPDNAASVKTSTGSYIAMQGNWAIISFKPEIFPGFSLDNLTIEDNAAEITKGKSKKNGDLQFNMKIERDREWLRRKVLITLYKNTNECFVQVDNHAGSNVVNFRGEIYPKKE